MANGFYRCPSCGGENIDWTVRDERGTGWTIKFTDASWPLCTRCADPKHPGHGLAIRPRLAAVMV